MLSRFLGQTFVYKIVLFLYAAFAFALAYNKVILSLASILLILICLLDFEKTNYKSLLKKNKIIPVLLIFMSIHLLSFFWSSNTAYFLKDLNTKLPIYLVPLAMVLKPVQSRKDYLLIFGVFLASITFFSIWNYINFYVLNFNELEDLRNMSQFTSHIRFGLMLIFGIVLCTYWILKLPYKGVALVLLLWFLFYTYYAEVFSAYLALMLVLVLFIYAGISASRFKKVLIPLFFVFTLAFAGAAYFLLKDFFKENEVPQKQQLAEKTAEGNSYTHFLENRHFINGNHVYSNISTEELTREWNAHSKFDIYDTNQFGYKHYYILIQYMASKGLKKDAQGFKKLNKQDIGNIEKGKINYLDENFGFLNRLQSLRDEFSDDNPNGKTFKQRIEYFKTGMEIFKGNWLIGVGPGDLDDAFKASYIQNKSRLEEENRLRAHNQLLTYFISFGIIGGLIFCYLIFISFRIFAKHKIHLASYFLCIIVISFLSEDTLETQVGATFFAFFFGLMINEGNRFLDLKQHEN